MLDLVRDGAGVRLLEMGECLGQGRARDVDAQQLGRDGGHVLLGQAERRGVERRVAGRRAAQRVEMRGHVAEVAVRLDERHGRGDRLDLLVRVAAGCGRRWRGDGLGGGGLRLGGGDVGDARAERAEDIGVEVVLAAQQPLDALQEVPRLGALDDAVVVGRADRHAPVRADRADRAGGDDGSLVRHQARDRCRRTQRARVRQRDGRAGEVVRRQLVRARLVDHLLVARVEGGEVHAVGALDDRHHQEARAVLALHVDRQAQVDAAGIDPVGLALDLGEEVAHRALPGRGLDDGPADEVGEAHLARRDLPVEVAASRLERGDVHLAEARRRRHSQAGDHVLRQPRGRPLDRSRTVGERRGRRRGAGLRWLLAVVRRWLGGSRHGLEAGGAGIEDGPPGGINAGRVAAVLLVQVGHVRRVDEVQVVERVGCLGWFGRGHVMSRIRCREASLGRCRRVRVRWPSSPRAGAARGRGGRHRSRSRPPAAPSPPAAGARR